MASCTGLPSPGRSRIFATSPSAQCTLTGSDVAYRVYTYDRGRTVYVAEGLAGYDSALALGLRTIVADQILPGEIAIASTEAGDPTAFARVQAGIAQSR